MILNNIYQWDTSRKRVAKGNLMPKAQAEPEFETWHRYFAKQGSDKAWSLVAAKRSSVEDQEMLAAAQAALYHWNIVGVELNVMQAKMLVAEVHAQLGMGDTAMAYAKEMHDYFTRVETLDWELALAHAIFAHAAYEIGDYDTHERVCEEALTAVDLIRDDADRDVVLKTFGQVPAPAGS